MNIASYYCVSCGYKTMTSQGLIPRKSGGCASCGSSAWKCPKCGNVIKALRSATRSAAQNPPSINRLGSKYGITERPVKINR